MKAFSLYDFGTALSEVGRCWSVVFCLDCWIPSVNEVRDIVSIIVEYLASDRCLR